MNKEQFLAMSLPYGLKVALTSDIEFYDDDFDDSLAKRGAIWELIGINNTSDLYISVCHGDGDLSNVLRRGDYWITIDRGYKPILHPLSNLTKTIEHKGEEFMPQDKINEFKLHMGNWNIGRWDRVSLDLIEDCPLCILLKLIEWHFDIAGLIEKGEAIDVNTLPENPYK